MAAHESVDLPVCMTWWSDRNRIVGQLSQQGQVLLQLHNTFRLYKEDDNPWPRHTVTSLQVFNPPELQWTFPAGQATYNPPELPPAVAEVARARFTAACEFSTVAPSGHLSPNDWGDGCGAGCFAAPLRDAASLHGKVAHLQAPMAALRTATLTMATLTMATLTMATLTMATLTIARWHSSTSKTRARSHRASCTTTR